MGNDEPFSFCAQRGGERRGGHLGADLGADTVQDPTGGKHLAGMRPWACSAGGWRYIWYRTYLRIVHMVRVVIHEKGFEAMG